MKISPTKLEAKLNVNLMFPQL